MNPRAIFGGRLAPLLVALAGNALLQAEDKPAAAPPASRHELWVPSKDIDAVLKKHPNAVLLDRAQYEALIRDAGKTKPEEAAKPPVPAVVEKVRAHVELAEGAATARVTLTLTVNGLADGWNEAAVPRWNEWDTTKLALTAFDGGQLQFDRAKDRQPKAIIIVKDRGRREVRLEFTSTIKREGHRCSAVVPVLGDPLEVTASLRGSITPPPSWLVRDGVATVPMSWSWRNSPGLSLQWLEGGAGAGPITGLTQTVECFARLEGTEVASEVRLAVRSAQGLLPERLRFTLPDASAYVVKVDESAVASWTQDGPVIEIVRRPGLISAAQWRLSLIKPAPESKDGALPLVLDVPRLEGAVRIAAHLALATGAGYEVASWPAAPAAPVEGSHSLVKEVLKQALPLSLGFYPVMPDNFTAMVRRVSDRFSADVDLHALITQHELALRRTLALHGEEGRVQRAEFSLPEGEQFLGLDFASGEVVEWKQTAPSAFEIVWPKGLEKGKHTTLTLRSRKELPAEATQAPGGGAAPASLFLQNVTFPGAVRLAGYAALDFDESWKVATSETTGLETRDARETPVQGRMAWFHLRDYRLALGLSRHEPVLDASITAYALPRARTVEIEGQLALEVTRAPLRSFILRLPPSAAGLLRWDSPLIGERQLDAATGTWTLTLRKELLGGANLRWHLSLPGETVGGGSEGSGPVKGDPAATDALTHRRTDTLAATLPSLTVSTARRFTGTWVIEANTDTELSYETKGLQPFDALRAPAVEGYAPRHRVLAAYGYGSAAHELKLKATRHESTRLVSAVVETLTLTSVLARDGTARHAAELRLRHSGDQFFAVRLPSGATLLSTSVDRSPVKPVTAGADEVRVPLPRGQGGSGLAQVTVLYETKAGAWSGSGNAGLQPLAFDAAVPVLTTSWRVYAPEGYSYVEPETTLVNGNVKHADQTFCASAAGLLYNFAVIPADALFSLGQSEVQGARAVPPQMIEITPEYPKPMFVGTPVPMTAAPMPSRPDGARKEVLDALARQTPMKKVVSNSTAAIQLPPSPAMPTAGPGAYYVDKVQRLTLPSVQLNNATVEAAIDFLRTKSREVDTIEKDPARRGVDIIVQPGAAPSSAKITLDLKDVPLNEALRYVTELAGMKYRVEGDAVIVTPITDVASEQYSRTFKVPPDFLMGGWAVDKTAAAPADPFAPANGDIRGLASRTTALGVLKDSGIAIPEGASAAFQPGNGQLVVRNTGPNLDQVQALVDDAWRAYEARQAAKVRAKSGLLPVKLELPTTGRIFEFRGNQKPEELTLHYQSWERQIAKACGWLLLGLAMFWRWGRRRPWWRTLGMIVLATFGPPALLPSWVVVCNALLAGWLLGLAVWLLRRLAARVDGWQGAGNTEHGAEGRAHA